MNFVPATGEHREYDANRGAQSFEVSTFDPNTFSGDTLAAFPYAYRIQ